MLNKNRIDKLTWLILNHVISAFGLRMRNEELIYIYKIPQDGCKNIYKIDRTLAKGDTHVIIVTTDLNEVFKFCGLDRTVYEEGFTDMFAYSSWLVKNCSYLTRAVVTSLKHGVESDSLKADDELWIDLKKFLLFLNLSHEEVRDNDIFPAMLYYNIKEEIVRNFFFGEELEEKFHKVKKTRLFKNELANKFNSDKLVRWVPELKDDSTLINIFGSAFILSATGGKRETFPDYLVDSEEAEIRRDVKQFYEFVFTQSDEYKLYIIEGESDGPLDE
jgi:hypothetical protein